jgi:hypothetical protein
MSLRMVQMLQEGLAGQELRWPLPGRIAQECEIAALTLAEQLLK